MSSLFPTGTMDAEIKVEVCWESRVIETAISFRGTTFFRLNFSRASRRLKEHDPQFNINILRLTFLDTITNVWFMSSLQSCALFFLFFSFPRFILTSPEGLSRHGYNTRKFSVPRKGHGRNICGLQSCLSPIVFICVEWSFADVQQHFINKQTKK